MDNKLFLTFPKTSIEFDEKFNSEEACELYLFEKRWGSGFSCSRCKHTEYWKGVRQISPFDINLIFSNLFCYICKLLNLAR